MSNYDEVRSKIMNTKTEFETLGDECKAAEMLEAGRSALPTEPIVCRLDGRGFSKFTKGLARPYDERMSNLMIDVVKHLVQETNASIGYTQSDEITLIWDANREPRREDGIIKETRFFGGRLQKIASVCAAMATQRFNKFLVQRIPEKADADPIFDGRAWPVYSSREAFANLLWRERDATKNSITMAATTVIDHKKLEGVRGEDKKKMMLELGIDWNDYPTFFKRGVYVKRVTQLKTLDDELLAKIPEGKRPAGPVERSRVIALDLPPIGKILSSENVLFSNKIQPEITLKDGSTYIVFDYNLQN